MFNWVDFLVILAILYFLWQGWETGFFGGILNFLSTTVSLIISLFYYSAFGDLLTKYFSFSHNLAQLIGFFGLLVLLGFGSNYFLSFFYAIFAKLFLSLPLLRKADKVLGIFPSLVTGVFLITVLTLLPIILPFNPGVRRPVEASWWGQSVLSQVYTLEPALEHFVRQLPTKNLLYILNPPTATEKSVTPLYFPSSLNLATDEKIEEGMLTLVNQEREKVGLRPLMMDSTLREIARAQSKDMFERKFFSHYNPDGLSPFDRMANGGAIFSSAGENLAYAPTLEIAHRGLMNSPGHRENILQTEFGRVGIGVIDGGINGIMFTQNFAD